SIGLEALDAMHVARRDEPPQIRNAAPEPVLLELLLAHLLVVLREPAQMGPSRVLEAIDQLVAPIDPELRRRADRIEPERHLGDRSQCVLRQIFEDAARFARIGERMVWLCATEPAQHTGLFIAHAPLRSWRLYSNGRNAQTSSAASLPRRTSTPASSASP